MKTPLFRFALYAIIVYLTLSTPNPAIAVSQPAGANGTHVCGVADSQLTKQFSDQYPNRRYTRTSVATLNVGEPRTVRMIYFLPNDRPYRAEVVQHMKDEILNVQTFYAEQMEAHGYGKITFRIETDAQGEPMVHRMDGEHPDSYYIANRGYWQGIEQKFDIWANNVYCLVWDNSTNIIDSGAEGTGGNRGKSNGSVTITGGFNWTIMAHELGHAFGLPHNFRDGAYIMSYGPGQDQLSACSAGFLSVHPYFNPDISIEAGQPPTIELISAPQYPPGSKSVLVRLKINDSDGLHQVLLHSSDGLVACHGLEGEREAVVDFDYDGTFRLEGFISLSSLIAHPIYIQVVDTEGNISQAPFTLSETSPYHITTIKGHTSTVNFVALPRDEGPVVSGSWDGTVKLWDVETRHNITTLTARTNSVALSADGTILASGSYDGTIKLWDMATQQNIDTFEGHTNQVSSVAFSLDGTILASGSYDGTIKLWDMATQQNIGTFEGHTDAVSSVTFSADGTILASGSCDGTTKLWDVAAQQNIDILEEDGLAPCIYSVAFSPDGALLAIGRGNDPFGGTVKLWEVSTRRIIASFVPHLGSVTFVSFSRDGGTLASGSQDGTVKLWDVATYAQIASLPHTAEVWAVSFSPDGGTLVSGTRTGTVELWDMSMLVEARLEAVSEINIPDPNLRAAIAEAIGVPPSASIVRGHIERLTLLDTGNANITDLTGLEGATNLRTLGLGDNNISDISAVSGLTNLTELYLENNSVSDISAVSGLTQLTILNLEGNSISDISPLVENTEFGAQGWSWVNVRENPLSYQSIHTHIPILQSRGVTVDFDAQAHPALLKISGDNQRHLPGEILTNPFVVEAQDENGSPFVGVSVTFTVIEGGGTLSIHTTPTDAHGRGQSRLTLGPDFGTNTVQVSAVGIDAIAVFSAEAALSLPVPTTLSIVSGDNQNGLTGETLMQPFVVEAHDQYDDPIEGVTVNFVISTGRGSLSDTSVDSDANGLAQSTLTLGSDPGANIVAVSVEGIAGTVTFNAVAELLEFDLALPSGISLIHVPLRVIEVDGRKQAIELISDLYDALGGADGVNFLVTRDSSTQEWRSFFGTSETGTPVDRVLTDDMGILADMIHGKEIRLSGNPLGTNGSSAITLNPGLNLVGLPLRDPRISRVSNLLTLKGIGGNVPVIILTDSGEFKLVGQPGDPGDIEITGGQAFIMTAQQAAKVAVSGDGWYNSSAIPAAPFVGNADLHSSLTGIQVTDTTPVLGLRGSIVDEQRGTNRAGFRVIVKNLSTGKAVTGVTKDVPLSHTDKGKLRADGYQVTIVDVETGRAAKIGDTLEISVRSPSPLIGVQPVRYTVAAEDVKRSLIQLEDLVAYEIPVKTELLPNYPNPFNPETWMPYRLAEDAFVTLTIYDLSGQTVRSIDLGHRIAAVYENRSKALYWDGRNEFGEQVASGVYFYTLTADEYSATRKMVILK